MMVLTIWCEMTFMLRVKFMMIMLMFVMKGKGIAQLGSSGLSAWTG